MYFIKKMCMCDEDIMKLDEIITYGSLVQEAMREYLNIVDSKRREPTDSKKRSKYEPLLLKDSTVAIEDPVNKTMEKVYFNIHHNGKTA